MNAILIAMILAAAVPGQQEAKPVKDVIDAVREAHNAALDAWEYRVETGVRESEIEQRRWHPVRFGHRTRESRLSYRTMVVIPDVFAGKRIEGGRASLELQMSGPVDHEIKVYVDGELKVELPEVDPETRMMTMQPIVLSENATPGQTFEILISVTNPGIYPPHEFLDATRLFSFRRAYLLLDDAMEMRDLLDRFLINVETADALLRPGKLTAEEMAKRWPEFIDHSKIDQKDRRLLRRVLLKAVEKFDFEALEQGDSERLKASMHEVLDELAPVGSFAKRFTIYAVGNAHIDLAWLWRKSETVQIAASTYRSVLNNMEEFPELTYAQSQAQTYQWVEDGFPELYEDITGVHAAGKWDPVGGMWVEADCNVPGGEAWVRQLLYGQRYFREHYGAAPTLGWNPDSFGYNWSMPQLFSRAGIEAFVTQKLSWNDTTVFPYHLFWWEAPDGSRILAYLPTGSYVEAFVPERLIDQLLRFEQNTGIKEMLILIGLGNHGGGPNRDMLLRARKLAELPIFPNVEFITAHEYIERLKKYDLSNLPVWRNEMYMEGHRGTLTTQSETKRGNRKGEALMETTEKAASLAWLLGADYPAEELERAWKLVLFNQFHDILPGSSITPVYRDAAEDYALAQKLGKRALGDALGALVASDGSGKSLLVFNPLSWERDDVVRLALPNGSPANLVVRDPDGVEVPSRIVVSDDGLDRTLVFVAKGVPALGYAIYSLAEGTASEQAVGGRLENVIENEYLLVVVDPETGNISRILDKRSGWEVIPAGEQGNCVELHENLPSYWDAWNIGYTGRNWSVDKADSIELLESGPVRSLIRVKKSFLGLSKANREPTIGYPSSFFIQDIILYAGVPRLDIELRTDWWEDHTLLKIAFPLRRDQRDRDLRDPLRLRRAPHRARGALAAGALRGLRAPLGRPLRRAARRQPAQRRQVRHGHAGQP